jgi:hypothetical protein
MGPNPTDSRPDPTDSLLQLLERFVLLAEFGGTCQIAVWLT